MDQISPNIYISSSGLPTDALYFHPDFTDTLGTFDVVLTVSFAENLNGETTQIWQDEIEFEISNTCKPDAFTVECEQLETYGFVVGVQGDADKVWEGTSCFVLSGLSGNRRACPEPVLGLEMLSAVSPEGESITPLNQVMQGGFDANELTAEEINSPVHL